MTETFKEEPAIEGNARLIAAAPDLLKALQAVVADIQAGSTFKLESHQGQQVLAAIAKATQA